MKRIIVASLFVSAAGIAVAAIPMANDPTEAFDGPSALPTVPINLSVYEMIEATGDHQDIAEPYCDTHATLTGKLYYDFCETLEDTAELDERRRLEMWRSDMLGTWTRVFVRSDGIACVAGTGTFDGSGGVPMDMIEQQDA